jgi:hypothetical protein
MKDLTRYPVPTPDAHAATVQRRRRERACSDKKATTANDKLFESGVTTEMREDSEINLVEWHSFCISTSSQNDALRDGMHPNHMFRVPWRAPCASLTNTLGSNNERSAALVWLPFPSYLRIDRESYRKFIPSCNTLVIFSPLETGNDITLHISRPLYWTLGHQWGILKENVPEPVLSGF